MDEESQMGSSYEGNMRDDIITVQTYGEQSCSSSASCSLENSSSCSNVSGQLTTPASTRKRKEHTEAEGEVPGSTNGTKRKHRRENPSDKMMAEIIAEIKRSNKSCEETDKKTLLLHQQQQMLSLLSNRPI